MISIIGSNGFVGKNLIQICKERGLNFTALTRKDYGDIRHSNAWKNILKGSVVVHLAARVHVMEENSKDPLAAFREVNVQGTLNLARAAKEMGIKKFIFISSIKVNGEETFEHPFFADDKNFPLDPYSISKKEAEIELLKLHKKGEFDVVIIRPPLIYGKGVKANFQNLFKLVEKRIPLPFGCVSNKRSLVSVFNLCDLIIHCIEHENSGGEIFLVSDDHDYSLKEIIEKMGKVLNIKPIFLYVPVSLMTFLLKVLGRKKYGDRLFGNLQVDIKKTKNILGWKPKYSFQDTFE